MIFIYLFYFIFPSTLNLFFACFQVGFPLLLALIWVYLPRFWLPLALLAFTIASLIASAALTPVNKNFAFYLLPMRAWEMLLGALLAWLRSYRVPSTHLAATLIKWWPLAEVLSVLGIGMIVVAYFVFTHTTLYPSYNALLPCAGAALVILSNHNKMTLVGRFLSFHPFVWVGKISYSLYLWHWPVFVYMSLVNVTTMSTGTLWAGVFVSFGFAVFSFFAIENPFRSKTLVSNSTFALLVVVCWAALLGFGIAVSGGLGGLRGSLLQNPPKNGPVWGSTVVNNLTVRCLVYKSDSELDMLYSTDLSVVTPSTILGSKGWECGEFNYVSNGNRPYMMGPGGDCAQMVVFGTSHAEQYGRLFAKLASEYSVRVAMLAIDGNNGRFSNPWSPWDQTRLVRT
jgi:hypothetical protein